MAKRTPRSEPADITEAAAPRRSTRQGSGRRATQAQSVSDQQSGPAVMDTESAVAPEPQTASARAGDTTSVGFADSPRAADTFAATGRPEANDARSDHDWSPTQDESASRTTAAEPSETQSQSMSSQPNEGDIRRRAYELYVERGAMDGAHDEDWYRAERELKQNRS